MRRLIPTSGLHRGHQCRVCASWYHNVCTGAPGPNVCSIACDKLISGQVPASSRPPLQPRASAAARRPAAASGSHRTSAALRRASAANGASTFIAQLPPRRAAPASSRAAPAPRPAAANRTVWSPLLNPVTYKDIATCYAHFMSDVEKHSNLIANAQNHDPFMNDLRAIHGTTIPAVTEVALDLFYSKWEDKGEDAIIEHIKEVYAGDWANWATSSLPPGLPTTNNGLEGLNFDYKNTGTCRSRAEFATFARLTSAWVHKKSVNDEGFPDSPKLDPWTWQHAYLALGSNFNFKQREDHVRRARGELVPPPGSEERWLVPSTALVASLDAPSTAAQQREIFSHAAKFLTFLEDPASANEFHLAINTMNNFYILEPLAEPRGEFIHFSCTCTQYAKLAACSHSLAKGLEDQMFEVPSERSFATLGRKRRGKGRIAKAAPALTRQPVDRASQQIGRGFSSSQALDPACFLCGETRFSKKNKIIFCDGCDCGYHQNCLNPKLRHIPEGEWFCSDECEHL